MDPLTAPKSANRPPPSAPSSADAAPPDAGAAARREAERKKRTARRGERAAEGLEGLQTWLADLIRQGLAWARQQPASYFESMAGRMAEAQAPGIARRLRGWPAVFAAGGDDWADRVLEELGSLQGLLNGAARLDELPAGLRASVRSSIGWTVDEKELLAVPGAVTVADRWQVLGQRVEEDGSAQRVQRTWLMGEKTGRTALCLSFAAAARPLGVSLVPGKAIDSDLTFYPGAVALRATVTARRDEGAPAPFAEPPGQASIREALDRTAALLAGDPWLERSPWLVRGCLPIPPRAGLAADLAVGNPAGWSLRDREGASVPLSPDFENAWPLLAVSAGTPVTVFGEWDGRTFLPLSVIADGRLVALGGALP